MLVATESDHRSAHAPAKWMGLWDWGQAQIVSLSSGLVVRGPCAAGSHTAQAMLVCLECFLGAPRTSLCLRHGGCCSSDQSDVLYRTRVKYTYIVEQKIDKIDTTFP